LTVVGSRKVKSYHKTGGEDKWNLASSARL
jgi:hypothetical protein